MSGTACALNVRVNRTGDIPLHDEQLAARLRQAARQRRRGDYRRAMQLLKQAAFDEAKNAGIWTRYALSCMSTGKTEDAARAFAQAIWLQEKAGRERGAQVTRELAERVAQGQLPTNYDRTGKATWSAFARGTAGYRVTPPAQKQEGAHPYRRMRSRKRKG